MARPRGIPLKMPSLRASDEAARMGARSDCGGATATGRSLKAGSQTRATAIEKAGI